MQITIEIPENKSTWLLSFLKEIPDIKIYTQTVSSNLNPNLIELSGSWDSKMTMEEIDLKLKAQKDEWQ